MESAVDTSLDSGDGDVAWDKDGLEENIGSLLQDGEVGIALQSGHDLRQYSAELASQLHLAEEACLDSYFGEASRIAELLEMTLSCGKVLDSLEKVLLSYQKEFRAISGDMKTLQESTASISMRASNRKLAMEAIGGIRDKLTLPIETLNSLSSTKEVTEAYLEKLKAVHFQVEYLRANPVVQSSSLQDSVLPRLCATCRKEVGKVRSFLDLKLEPMGQPQTNVRILQQNVLARYRFCFDFLQTHSEPLARELQAQYVDRMSKAYVAQLRKVWRSSPLSHSQGLAASLHQPTKLELLVSKEQLLYPKKAREFRRGSSGLPLGTLQSRMRLLQGLSRDEQRCRLVLDPAAVVATTALTTFTEIFTQMAVLYFNTAVQEAEFSVEFFLGGAWCWGSASASSAAAPAVLSPQSRGDAVISAVLGDAQLYLQEKLSRHLKESVDWPGLLVLLRLFLTLRSCCGSPSRAESTSAGASAASRGLRVPSLLWAWVHSSAAALEEEWVGVGMASRGGTSPGQPRVSSSSSVPVEDAPVADPAALLQAVTQAVKPSFAAPQPDRESVAE
eukprot:RCo042746